MLLWYSDKLTMISSVSFLQVFLADKKHPITAEMNPIKPTKASIASIVKRAE